MEVIRLMTLIFVIGLFIMVYVTIKDKGYGVGWALFATAISMLISPVIVLIICMYFIPDADDEVKK
jgi:antibiotic biosynthesis monooxygenase (ABM) superfamily enzyme